MVLTGVSLLADTQGEHESASSSRRQCSIAVLNICTSKKRSHQQCGFQVGKTQSEGPAVFFGRRSCFHLTTGNSQLQEVGAGWKWEAEARAEETEQFCQFYAHPKKIPGYWDSSYKAVHNAGFCKVGLNFWADIRQLRWQAAEEDHVGPIRQIRVMIKTLDSQFLELIWEEKRETERSQYEGVWPEHHLWGEDDNYIISSLGAT